MKKYVSNPFYWEHEGKPVLLLGGSRQDNLFQIDDLREHLELIAEAGGNYVRNTMSSRKPGDVMPFRKVNGLFDLTDWDAEYWQRFAGFLEETERRNIIVQIEIWDPWDFQDYMHAWELSPWNPKNNKNYSETTTSLRETIGHRNEESNCFFWSIPEENNDAALLEYQKHFVDKCLHHTFRHSHVLYCINNETTVTPLWGEYWARYIKDQAVDILGSEMTIPVTDMRNDWNLFGDDHESIVNRPDVYDFIEISQNNHNTGLRHYEAVLRRRSSIKDHPRPMNNVKIYGNKEFGTPKDAVERFWRNLFAGAASVRFHRPEEAGYGLGINQLAQKMIRSARMLFGEFDIFHAAPANDLLAKAKDEEIYLLKGAQNTLALYFPAPGRVCLNDVGLSSGKATVKWLNIDQAEWGLEEEVPLDGRPIETPAETGQWGAIVSRSNAPCPSGR